MLDNQPAIVRAAAAAAVAFAAASPLAGCAQEQESEQVTVYCVDADGVVQDSDRCEDDDDRDGGGGFFYYVANGGSPHYAPGKKVPNVRSGKSGTLVSPKDQNARAKAGMPKTGTVKSGSTVTRGGFGTTSGGSRGGSSGS